MTADPITARSALPPHASLSSEFLEALPALGRIEEDLAAALRVAMTQGGDQERGFAGAAWMLSKALRFLLAAAQSDDPAAFDAALAEVDTDVLAAAGHVRDLRAAAALPDELAAVGEAARLAGLDLGECAVIGVSARVVALEDTSGATSDQLQVQVDGDGRVSWGSAHHGHLAVDGRAQLDLAAVLDGLAAAYARTVIGA